MNIGITGARGRLAPLLVKHFQERGTNVCQYSRSGTDGMLPLTELFENPPNDLLIHCAWSTVPLTAEADPDAVFREDLPLLEKIVRSTEAYGTRIVFPSSGAVYGNTGETPASEDDALQPLGAYAKAKITAENFLLENAASRLVILRTTNLLGESADPNKPQGILPRLVDSALHGTRVEIWGDGSATKDYIHYSDFLSGLEASLSAPGIWNVGSGCSYSLVEIIKIVEELIGRPIHFSHRPSFEWDVSHSIISVERLKTTGWKPKMSMSEAVERFLRDLKQR